MRAKSPHIPKDATTLTVITFIGKNIFKPDATKLKAYTKQIANIIFFITVIMIFFICIPNTIYEKMLVFIHLSFYDLLKLYLM